MTGATGFIGIQLVKRLVSNGELVHALYRSESKADEIRLKGVALYRGDILDNNSLSLAMEGCDQVFHTAAFAGVWSKDPSIIHQLNVTGALNVVKIAAKCGIKRVVVTSTAGILGPSDKEPVHEDTPVPSSFFTPYEESKFIMEQELMKVSDGNPEIIIVNPTRVFGPGILSVSNGVTRMIRQYVEGNWRFIPGTGKSIGNYVHVEDVVTGHLLAMAKGNPGERYVLGGDNISYIQIFQYIREFSLINIRLFRIPLWLMLTAAGLMKIIAKLTGNAPLIVPGLVRKFNLQWIVSSDKAKRDLGYKPRSVKEGIKGTLEWINNINSIQQ